MPLNIQSIPYPEFTIVDRNNLSNVNKGFIIFNSDISNFEIYNGSSWVLLSGTKLKEWSLYFTAVKSQMEILHNSYTSIDSVSLGPKVSSIEYSIDDGMSWGTPSFPIILSSEFYSKWRITSFNSTNTESSIIVKGTESDVPLFFDMWTVDSPGFTYSMTLIGTVNEVIRIDWGDDVFEEYTFTGINQIITHDYEVGQFQQKWAVEKLDVTKIYSVNQNLISEISKEIQNFYSLIYFRIDQNQLTGDLSKWSNSLSLWDNIEYFHIGGNLFYGNLRSWDLVLNNWTNLTSFFINSNQFTGDLGEWSAALASLTNIQYFYISSNQFSDNISNWSASLLNWSNLRYLLLYSNQLTGLNDLINNPFFVDRSIYTKINIFLGGNSESLTGTYQQPDIGTYAGDLNDLTEIEIDNLAIGTDFDGGGSNTIWSTLEKVWILELLEVSSTDTTKRYGFNITY